MFQRKVHLAVENVYIYLKYQMLVRIGLYFYINSEKIGKKTMKNRQSILNFLGVVHKLRGTCFSKLQNFGHG